MIEINLLPGGAARRPAAGKSPLRMPAGMPSFGGNPYVMGAGAVGVAVTLLLGFLYWNTSRTHASLTADIEREVADSTRLANTIRLVETMDAQKDTIEQKIDVIRGVDERRYVWPHVLDEVSRAVPPYTWLTKVAVLEDESPPAPAAPVSAADSAAAAAADSASAPEPEFVGPSFSIEGNTGTTQALTRFMKNLEASPMVREVQLITSEQTVQDGRTFTKFTLEARYERPDTALVQTVPLVTVR